MWPESNNKGQERNEPIFIIKIYAIHYLENVFLKKETFDFRSQGSGLCIFRRGGGD